MPIKPRSKATYHKLGKTPKFTPKEYTAILRAMDDTAWIRPDQYDAFRSALKKLNDYVSSES